MSAAIPPRLDVTADQIDQVVHRFYAAVRSHDVLAPIFATHVQDWPAHEEKIARFWRNAILHERIYDGNPMQVHLAAQEVQGLHFPVWLTLFEQTLQLTLPIASAQAWSELAHRIGRGLRMGVDDLRHRRTAAPHLR